jgi:hypothetical protein
MEDLMTAINRRNARAAVAVVPVAAVVPALAANENPTRFEVKKPGRDRSIEELSFVYDYWVRPVGRKRGESFRLFWNVQATGDYGGDCASGERMADEFLTWLCDQHDYSGFSGGSVLGWIAQDMSQKRTGLEVGFLSRAGNLALVANYLVLNRMPNPEWRDA